MPLVNSFRGTYGPQSKAEPGLGQLASFVGIEPVQSINLTQETSSSVVFSNIPQNYKHLLLISSGSGSSNSYISFRFNNNSANSYYSYRHGGDGTTTYPFFSNALSSIGASYLLPSSLSIYGAVLSIIYNYSSSSMYTTTMSYGGWDANGSGQAMMDCGIFYSTVAVNALSILQNNSGLYNRYSSFSLFGFGESL